MGLSSGVKRNTGGGGCVSKCLGVHVCECECNWWWGRRGCLHRGGLGGMAEIVMQEEKVRQCKVFVVLMQGEDSCSERSDAAAAPAWKRVLRG